MSLSRYEQETIVNFNEEERTASIYTHNKALARKLAKLAQERSEECRLEKTTRDGAAVQYTVPKKWVKVSPPKAVTEAQREAARERAKKSNLARFLRTPSTGSRG